MIRTRTTTTTPSRESARVRLYAGAQQQGKTTLALTQLYHGDRIPLLVDPRGTLLRTSAPLTSLQGGKSIRWDLPRTSEIPEVGRLVFRERIGCIFMPRSLEAFEQLCAGALTEKTGRIAFLIDEWAMLCTQRWVPRPLSDGIRTNSHINVDFYITTQCPQDIESRLRNCIQEVYAFQNADVNAQKCLRQWFPDSHEFGTLPPFSVRKWPKFEAPRKDP